MATAGEKFEKAFESCFESRATQGLYFAAILVLLVLVVFHLKDISEAKEQAEKEYFSQATSAPIGGALGDVGNVGHGIWGGRGGFNTEMSSTNQGGPTGEGGRLKQNAEVYGQSNVGRVTDLRRGSENFLSDMSQYNEHLSGRKQSPNVWNIGSELATYQRGQEHMYDPASGSMTDAFLTRELY